MPDEPTVTTQDARDSLLAAIKTTADDAADASGRAPSNAAQLAAAARDLAEALKSLGNLE